MPALVELVRQHYENLARGEPERDREFMHADVVTIDPSTTMQGFEAFLQHQRIFLTAFPDAQAELVRFAETGDTVMVEGVFSGTHTGPLQSPAGDVLASGRPLRLPFAEVAVVRDGLIVERRVYFDQLLMAIQLGLMPAPA
jgi:ketosteroid isomerase-like protein